MSWKIKSYMVMRKKSNCIKNVRLNSKSKIIKNTIFHNIFQTLLPAESFPCLCKQIPWSFNKSIIAFPFHGLKVLFCVTEKMLVITSLSNGRTLLTHKTDHLQEFKWYFYSLFPSFPLSFFPSLPSSMCSVTFLSFSLLPQDVEQDMTSDRTKSP